MYIYVYIVRMYVMPQVTSSSYFNTKYKLLSELPTSLMATAKDGDHLWTYLFNGQSNRGYHMAKRFHLSMPLFGFPLTVEVTRHLGQPLISMATSMRVIARHKIRQECHLSVDTSCKAHGVLDPRHAATIQTGHDVPACWTSYV